MSFGQKLGQKTRAAHVDSRDRWVEETMQQFMARCEQAAGQGQCSTQIQVKSPQLANDEALEHLKNKLAELGLKSYEANDYKTAVLIKAWWNMGPDVPEKTGIAPKGTKGNCPICHENRHMVALMPCGHTVCQQCQRSQQLRQCPMCRKNLTGATEALFMG
eukprot:Skav234873  [mRNA]  locus=scaffold840:355266:355748:- [translate_table: standard]